MTALKMLLLIVLGFGGGVVIAGAVFAFIAIIGVVPRFAQKTKTEKILNFMKKLLFGAVFLEQLLCFLIIIFLLGL